MRYEVWDVFTEAPFAGNPLAVVWAQGLADDAMLRIAREFGYSETTFVAPVPDGAEVRIWTPAEELPFAGHPLIGTACALASDGAGPDLTLRIPVGAVAAQARAAGGRGTAAFVREAPLARMGALPARLVAACCGLAEGDLARPPERASLGTPFAFAEVAPDALDCAAPDLAAFRRLEAEYPLPIRAAIYLWARDGGGVRARMFGLNDALYEDPATGSAAATLAALLAARGEAAAGAIRQGEAMGRPSLIETSVHGEAVRVAGAAVRVMSGALGA